MSDFVPSPDEFHSLFLNDTPFLDVRAEVEFAKGSFPTSVNAPILNTDERHAVGSCYKQQGQQQAIELGHQLVGGDVKQQRVERWCQFAHDQPDAHLYCWRGGMRSNITQQWMREAGVDIPLISGGYKALRGTLLAALEQSANRSLVVVAGQTGCAKTSLINALASGIDLEHHANHRGSSFGRRVAGPPSQANFENRLAIDLLKKCHQYPALPLFIEDESRRVGAVSVPLELWQAMSAATLVVVEASFEQRVQCIIKDYIVDMLAEHVQADPVNGAASYRQHLLGSLERIKKRLGGSRYSALHTIMDEAIARQLGSGDINAHQAWVEPLLNEYYDPLYDYQLANKEQRVSMRGSYQDVLGWCQQQSM